MAKRKETGIERKMSIVLQNLHVGYRREFKIGTYPVDFYLPKYNLSIQVDGDYWHGNVKGKKTPQQLFQIQRDNRCLTYHKYKKISLLRFSEHVIDNNIGLVVKKVRKAIEDIKRGALIYECCK